MSGGEPGQVSPEYGALCDAVWALNNTLCNGIKPSRNMLKNTAEVISKFLENGAAKPRTHCKNGHPWTPENVRYNTNGWGYCKACITERQKQKRRQQ